MFKARIADFNILFEEYYNLLYLRIGDFESEFDTPDIVVKTTLEEIEEETRVSEIKRKPYRMEEQRAFRNLADMLPLKDSCVLHSCFIKVGERGIAFSARSGTGKTTHMNLWSKILGDKMKVVNGDKPIVRFIGDAPYGYGTPWMGKEGIGSKDSAKLTDICMIERSANNETVPISKDEGMLLLMQQIHMPTDVVALSATMKLIDRIASSCRFWKIRCNMDIDAAYTAYNTIFGLND